MKTSSSPSTASAPALRRFDDLPGPRGVPLFGNALQVEPARFHQQLEQWCRDYGPIYRLRLGPRRIVVVGDHQLVAQVLRDRPDGFRRTTRLQEVWTELGLPPGVFGANGESWKRQRRLVMAGFDPSHVRRYFPALQQVAQRLAERWTRAARAGAAIDLQRDLMRYTVDAIAGLAFGSEVDTLGSDGDVIQRHLDRIFPAVFSRVMAPLPVWRWVRRDSDRRLEESIAEVRAAVDDFIARARERMRADPSRREQPPNLLEAMIAAADRDDDGIDDAVVAGNVLTMLLAGEDTTANTLAWMVHLLWRHPQALAKAAAEVRQTCPADAPPSLEQVGALDYVEACAHETMRLKPVAPQLPVQAIADTAVGDVQVDAGMIVLGMMRRDAVSDDFVPVAASFVPERWLAGDGSWAASSPKRTSMPFGAGPRICPGRYLALLEIRTAIATLLGRFEIISVDTPDGGDAREHLSFTMSPVGLTMRLAVR